MLQYNKVIEKRGERMPELSRFNGMVIYFYDTKHHNKPHIHVYYGDFEASVGIDGEKSAEKAACFHSGMACRARRGSICSLE